MNTYNSESVVIGTIIADPSILPEIEDILSLEDFNHHECRMIFADILKREKDERPIDVFSISETTSLPLDKLITYQQNQAGFTKNAISHAKKIKTLQKRARLTQIIQSNISAIRDEENSTDEILERLTLDLLKVSETENDKKGFVHINQAIKAAFNELEERVKLGGKLAGLSSGIKDLDDLTNGFKPGNLVIIAGRPSMGKTVLGLNIMDYNAMNGENCYFHSLEMTTEELAERSICAAGVADYGKVRTGNMDDTQWALYTNGVGRLQGSHMYVNDAPGQTLAQIRAGALRKKAEVGHISAIAVDYLQLIQTKGINRTNEIGEISRGLKALGKEIGCPIICLAQLSRKCEDRQDKRPMTSDLRDSGEIEQDADIIIMCYRDKQYNQESMWGNIGELIVTKNRGGKLGTVYVEFQGQHQRFVEAQWEEVERIKNITQSQPKNGGFKPYK